MSPPQSGSSVPVPMAAESDVVLSDGGTVHVRPIRPSDAEGLVRFHASLSAETIYFRFFAPYPQLSDRDVGRFTNVDGVERVAIVATLGDRMIGVGRYDVIAPGTAEIAFTVQDDHQGRGLGSVLLEHLAETARNAGLRKFDAEVLPENHRMIATFVEAGYRPSREVNDGVVSLTFDIQPTLESIAVRTAREHRAESASIARLLAPRSVVVVGAGRESGMGAAVVRNVVDGGYTGAVYAVNSRVVEGGTIGGVPAFRSLLEVPAPVDLVVVAVPAEHVIATSADAAAVGAVGLLVVSSGFAEVGASGRALQRELVRNALGDGMRVIGPNALGILNTDPAVSLNASVARQLPRPGAAGFFSQSGALGEAILEQAERRGVGISTFVSAGNRADVSGNDLMQFWEDDPATEVVLLYLESIGNPRKFTRVARRLSRRKPILAVRSGRTTQALPLGHRVRRSVLSASAVDALFEQSGVVQTATLTEMLDAAVILLHQALPAGRRVVVVDNSDALGVLAADALEGEGLLPSPRSVSLRGDCDVEGFTEALGGAAVGQDVDVLLVIYVPIGEVDQSQHLDALLHAATDSEIPVVAVLLASGASGGLLRRGAVTIPVFSTVEDAVRAVGKVCSYATWRATPEPVARDLLEVDPERAQAVLDRVLERVPEDVDDATADDAEVTLRSYRTTDELGQILTAYGIEPLRSAPVSSTMEAVRAARELGFPVALTAIRPRGVERADGTGVRLDLADDRAVITAWESLADELDTAQLRAMRVQSMVPRGVECRVMTIEDPLFGPVVTLSAGGSIAQLLGDRSYRIPPLSEADAVAMLDSPRVAPLLAGAVGPGGRAGLVELLLRVGRLAEDVTGLGLLVLEPVLVSADSLVVLGARARVRRPIARTDRDARRLH